MKKDVSTISEKPLRKKYDVFISHANKDKLSYVNDLNKVIKKLGINIFYDTDVLSWGDNFKQVILDETAESEFAIIVISKNFFGREYPASEKDIFPVSACTSNFDEWSALAGFLADMIEKYAEILIPEIEAGQIAVDELLAA